MTSQRTFRLRSRRARSQAAGSKDDSKYYFVSTDRYSQVKDGVGNQIGQSRLWSLAFTDITNPDLGGTIELLLDGCEAGQMYDNLTLNADGTLTLQEDVGGNAHNGKMWIFDPATKSLKLVARSDPARFGDLGLAATAGALQHCRRTCRRRPANGCVGSGSGAIDLRYARRRSGPARLHRPPS